MGKVFNKGLDKDDQKEGLFKRLKNLKTKMKSSYKQLRSRRKKFKKLKNIDKSKTLKAIGEISRKNDKANELLSEFGKTDKTLDNAELICTKTDGIKYGFNRFALPLKVIEITLDEPINYQTELKILRNKLNNDYNPRNPKKLKRKIKF